MARDMALKVTTNMTPAEVTARKILFYETRFGAFWCREHRAVCIVCSDGRHRKGFLMVMPL